MALARLLDRTGRLTGDLNRVQLFALGWLNRLDREASIIRQNEDFKNLILANNPELYQALFVEGEEVPEEEVEWRHPQTEGDVQRMMAELQDLGVAL